MKGITREQLLMHNGKSGVMTSINTLADRPRVQHIFYPPFLAVVSTLYVCLYQLHFLSFSVFFFLPSGQICSIRTQKLVLCSSILFLPTRFQASSIT